MNSCSVKPGATSEAALAVDRVLMLSGRLTINEAEAVREEMLRQLAGCDRLTLDIARLETVDIAGIQLLIAVRRSAERAGKSVRLAIAPGDPLLAALVSAGFRSPGDADCSDVSQDGYWRGRS